MHLPIMPIVLVFGLMTRMERAQEAAKQDYQTTEATISVELLPAPPPSPPRIEPTASKSAPSRAAPQPTDVPEEPTVGGEPQPAETDPGGEVPVQAAEPDALPGELEGEANVTLDLWFSTMREHELAPLLRGLLRCGKLGATLRRAELDALNDLDAAVFAGPRLDDPAAYTAALSHRLSPSRVKRSLSKLTWPRGKWLDESAVRIQAAGATRVVFERSASLVLAAPEPLWQKLRTTSRTMAMPSSNGRAFSLMLRDPAMPLGRIGLDVPKTIARMRLDAYAQTNGNVELRLRFDDQDEAAARENAPRLAAEIESALGQLRQVGSLSKVLAPLLGARSDLDFALPRMRFVARGKSIEAMATMPPADVEKILAKLTPFLCETGQPPASPKPSRASVR